jgi:hypothetical protein
MNMQAFHKLLAAKPARRRQRLLSNLTRASRTQILQATSELTWLIWTAEQSGA